MKAALLSVLSAAVLIPSASAQTILFDDFDSYDLTVLGNNAPWPAAIPGATPPLTWQTNAPIAANNPGGPQAIVSGNPAGRTGNVYHYQENASGQRTTYSSVNLGAAAPSGQWQISVDLYLNEITPVTSSFFNILTLVEGDPAVATNRLGSVGVSRRSASSTGDLVFSYADAAGTKFRYSSNSDGNRIALNTWYTLTFTGDDATKQFIISIEGEDFSFTTDALDYANSLTGFSTIAIGDTQDNGWPAAGGRSNSVYLDNLRLQAIPEPSTLALIPAALGLFGAARFVRNRRRHS